jgi:hypothetical protein
MSALFAAAEPPTIVLLLIGTVCLLLYASVRRIPRKRSQPVLQFNKPEQQQADEPDRRAA